MQLVEQLLTTRSAATDFPWQIASAETTTSPFHLVLKRKSGDPGRIIFVGVTTGPGTTYNPQLSTIIWSASGIRAGFFPAATSDVPANILSTSGDVFTTPTGYTGVTSNFTQFTNGAYTMSVWACQDGIALRWGAGVIGDSMWVIGDMMENNATDAVPVAFYNGSMSATISSTESLTISTTGGFFQLAGVVSHVGHGWTLQTDVSDKLRNSGAKTAGFFPTSLAVIRESLQNVYGYKLRQVCRGPSSLAAYEPMLTTGPVLSAVCMASLATSNAPWLTNFKV